MSRFTCCCDWGFDVLYPRVCELIYTTDCNQFSTPPGMSASWDLTVAGITDGSCTLCDNANGTFQLDIPGTFCRLTSDPFSGQKQGDTGCTQNNNYHWELIRFDGSSLFGGSGLNWYLRYFGDFAGTTFAYELDGAVGDFDPEGPNTFNHIFTDEGGTCATPPASLTIEPTCI